MKKTALILFAAALNTGQALALDHPRLSEYDHRVRYVTFNQDDVVQLNTVLGVATHIRLEDGERYVTHAFGDSEAYAFAIEGSHIFIKPQAEQANTNLVIVTDRRSYKFRLSFRDDRADATYELAFDYPDTRAREAEAAAQQAAVERAFEHDVAGYNLSYTMAGDLDIGPINAWDNGRFTYFKFAPNVDIPAIYLVDAEGNESLVNRTTEGDSNDIVVVHRVSPKFILRLGNRALAIFNEAYDPHGVPNESGTVSPWVEREVTGGN